MARAAHRVDVWRCLVAALLVAYSAASAAIPSLLGWPSALRFVLLGLLAGYLCLQPRRRRHLAEIQRWRRIRSASARAAVFMVLAIASIAWSSSPARTGLQAVALLLLIVAVAFTATRRWTTTERLVGDVRLVYWVLVGLTVPSFVGGVTHASFAYGYLGRYHGYFQSATTTAMVAALAVLLGWGLLSVSRHRGLYWASLAVCVATLVVAQSRGVIMALAGAGAWLAWKGGTRRLVRAGSLAIVTVSLVVLVAPAFGGSPPLVGPLVERFIPQEGVDYSTARVDAWERAVELWRERPILGHGFRSGETLFEQEREAGRLEFGFNTTHNGYLQVLLELGAVGLLVFVAAMVQVLRVVPKRAPPFRSSLSGVVVFGLLAQFTESPVFGTGSLFAFLYWLLVAAAVVAEVFHRSAVRAQPAHV
jgi:O-antigen ligase